MLTYMTKFLETLLQVFGTFDFCMDLKCQFAKGFHNLANSSLLDTVDIVNCNWLHQRISQEVRV